MYYSKIDKQSVLKSNANDESIGALLSQKIDAQNHVIAYFSKYFSKTERKHCMKRKELLTIVKAVEHFHPNLFDQKFLIRADNASLTIGF